MKTDTLEDEVINMKNIRKENARKIARILRKIGPESARLRTDSEWDLRIYYSSKEDNKMVIEMSCTSEYLGELFMDPLMKIELILDDEGEMVEAVPLYYLSKTIFVNEEYYSEGNPECWNSKLYDKDGVMDHRLSAWLRNIRIQRYLSDGKIEKL